MIDDNQKMFIPPLAIENDFQKLKLNILRIYYTSDNLRLTSLEIHKRALY